MLYRAENISVFVEVCNFKIYMPKKFGPAGDYQPLKVGTLKVKLNSWSNFQQKKNPHQLPFSFSALQCDEKT